MMPQVRIRNVSKEYKLVAGVFSPELLQLEEGKHDEPTIVHDESQDKRAKTVLTGKGNTRSKPNKPSLAATPKS